jgi:hypothetical protein
VIGLNSVAPAPKSHQRPDLFDGASQIVQGLLVDPPVNDVETLATINQTLIASGITAGDDQPKVVPYIFVAPRTPNRIGEIAQEVYRESYSGLRGMARSRDLALLGRLLGADRSWTRGELFSYLFFAPEFASKLNRGRARRRDALDRARTRRRRLAAARPAPLRPRPATVARNPTAASTSSSRLPTYLRMAAGK